MTYVLAVDDDPAMLRTLSINLRARDYQVETTRDGRSALESVQQRMPDVILLDLGLPDLDGVAVLTQLRSFTRVPIVVLSARHESDDKVEALDLGADDYVTKPFGMEELLARLRAAIRHVPPDVPPERLVVQTRTLMLDLGQQIARRDGERVHLTPTEWRLVEVLTRNPGHLVRQTELLQAVWGPSYHRETNYLRVYLAQLRRKLEEQPSQPRHFITEPGVGYRFVP
ncbi:MAG TPA: response regulator transcription factor [Propionibacteriaceae bacterium]